MATTENLLQEGDQGDSTKALQNLRVATTQALGYDQTDDGICSYRLQSWLLLLHTQAMRYEDYSALLERGASPAYGKIQDDVHRTLTTDPNFSKRVTQSALTRLLNTTAWCTYDHLAAETPLPPSPTLDAQPDGPPVGSHELDQASPPPTLDDTQPLARPLAEELPKTDLYVQGMNVLAAPILYTARSEAAAFSLFNTLLREQLASYFMPGLAGVHAALTLLDEAIALVDPELKACLPPANIYAFGPVMTLCASVPPLSEVLKLWDFIFAAGPHVGMLAVAAILIGMRDELISSDKAGSRLRSLGPLDGARTIQILRDVVLPKVALDEHLSDRIARHTHVEVMTSA